MSDTIEVLKGLQASISKMKSGISLEQGWGGFRNRHPNPRTQCSVCRTNPGQTSKQWATFNKANYWTCGNCVANKKMKDVYNNHGNGRCHLCNSVATRYWRHTNWYACSNHLGNAGLDQKKVTKKISDMISEEQKKISDSKKEEKTIFEAAQPYISSGLAEPFAIAIARDIENMDEVLDLWEQTWWKQYPAEDILVCAVLDGELSEENGRWLNDIRSDHERLALSCVRKEIDLDWAKALLEAGYLNHPEAVPDILDGGHPGAIARIRKLDIDVKLLPPQLGFKVINKLRSKTRKKRSTDDSQNDEFKQKINSLDYQELDSKILSKLSVQSLNKIIDGMYPKSTKNPTQKRHWISQTWRHLNERKFPANESTTSLRNSAKFVGLPKRTSMNKQELTKNLKSMKTKLRGRILKEANAKKIKLG